MILGVENDYPLFGRIENIYIVNTNDTSIEVRLLSTITFCSHRHAFQVEYTNQYKTVDICSLYNVFPLHLRRICIHGHSQLCIIPKHHIILILYC